MPNSSANGASIDKDQQYGDFRARERQGARFLHRVACKAVDIAPEDDVNITTTTTGISGRTILGSVGLASAAACIIAYMLNGSPAPPTEPQEVQFTIEHFDQFGDPIYVPPVE